MFGLTFGHRQTTRSFGWTTLRSLGMGVSCCMLGNVQDVLPQVSQKKMQFQCIGNTNDSPDVFFPAAFILAVQFFMLMFNMGKTGRLWLTHSEGKQKGIIFCVPFEKTLGYGTPTFWVKMVQVGKRTCVPQNLWSFFLGALFLNHAPNSPWCSCQQLSKKWKNTPCSSKVHTCIPRGY